MNLRPLPLLGLLLGILLVSPNLGAQTTTFTVDRLYMAGAPDDGIGVWRPRVSEKTRFFGQLGTTFSVRPLRVDNIVDNQDLADRLRGDPLAFQLITTLNAGVEIEGRLTLAACLPFTAYQTGSATNNAAAGFDQTAVVPNSSAVGDLRLEARFVAFRNAARTFQIGLAASGYVPTGNRYAYAGDNGPGALVSAAVEYDFGPAFIVVNGGYRIRPTVQLNQLTVSNEVIYALGAYVPLRGGRVRLGAEFFGAFGAGTGNVGDLDTTPIEWMLNGRWYLTRKKTIYAGAGVGTRLSGGYAPDLRAVFLLGGSLRVTDTTPRSPDFRYVFDKRPDRDGDGIPDELDACPHEPGEPNPDPTKSGCPKYIRRLRGSAEIEVLRRIEFAFDKADILPSSYPILDEVVALLLANPDVEEMTIEGHTDNQGSAQYNQRLSEDRARSVQRYLEDHGVEGSRLRARGYGLLVPIASNDTEEGRQKNRRVEFHVTQQQ